MTRETGVPLTRRDQSEIETQGIREDQKTEDLTRESYSGRELKGRENKKTVGLSSVGFRLWSTDVATDESRRPLSVRDPAEQGTTRLTKYVPRAWSAWSSPRSLPQKKPALL